MKTEKIEDDKLDELEKNIISEFESNNFNNIPHKEWKQKQWTEKINNAVGCILRQRGYKVYASNCKEADNGEWLYDLTGIEEKGGYFKSFPLVLESEWKGCNQKKYKDEILYDFRKLIVSRADHRVMIFEVGHKEKKENVVEPFLQHVRNCRHSMAGDRYLFAWWKRSKNKWIFDYSVYEVVNG